MAKTIFTQDEEILNFDNVVSIYVVSKEKKNNSKESYYYLYADTVNDNRETIGVYDDIEEANNSLYSIVEWLQKEMYGVYRLDRKEDD